MAGVVGIASILHRDTIAVLVGSKTFERGEACFREGRVSVVTKSTGELRGTVRPSEGESVRDYVIRIWIRDEGVAYECTCPIGVRLQFCKHAVALSLAHLDRERAEAEAGIGLLKQAMLAVGHEPLVDGLAKLAHRDPALNVSLKRMCLEILETPKPPT